MNTTSVAFSIAENASDDSTSLQRGLLASDSTIDLDIAGCSKLERTDTTNRQPAKCDEDTFSTSNVQLSHLTLPANTRVTLWVLDDAVHMKIERPAASSDPELLITSSNDSFGLSKKGKTSLPGEWRIVPSGKIITLVLRDGAHSNLRIDEQEQPLNQGSSVRFRSEHGNALLGGGLLVLPQLPKEMEEIKLGRGTFSIQDLKTGVLRQLSLNREDKRIQSLHVELTGFSDDLSVYDTYSAHEHNEALTWFDANSGKDRRLKLLAQCLLLLGLLSVVSSVTTVLSNFSQMRVNRAQIPAIRSQMRTNRLNTLTQRGDRDLVRVAEALEKSNELRVAGQKREIQTHSGPSSALAPSADEGATQPRSGPEV